MEQQKATEKEAMSYLADSAHEMTSLESMLSADSLTKTFIRYNTTLCRRLPLLNVYLVMQAS